MKYFYVICRIAMHLGLAVMPLFPMLVGGILKQGLWVKILLGFNALVQLWAITIVIKKEFFTRYE